MDRREILKGAVEGLMIAAAGNTVFAAEATSQHDINHNNINSSNAAQVVFIPSEAGAVVSNVQSKLRESASIKDYGALGDGVTDDTTAIQSAINAVNSLGGGTLRIPSTPAYYKITTALVLHSNMRIVGDGYASRIHSVNTKRSSGFVGGSSGSNIKNVEIQSVRLTSTTTWSRGVGSSLTGCGVNVYCDDLVIENCDLSNWSDAGISATDSQRVCYLNNRVDATAQGLQIFASLIDCYGGKIIGNTVTNTGLFNGIDLEGNTAGGKGLHHECTVSYNYVNWAWNGIGINIENSPGTAVIGNNVMNSGKGKLTGSYPAAINGIFLWGSSNCTVSGNVSNHNEGYGIFIGGGSSGTSVSGNSTYRNLLGSCAVADSNTLGGKGISPTHNVAMGVNSFEEGDIATSGNFSFLNRITNLKFSNVAVPDTHTLDWYEEGTFVPLIAGSTSAGTSTVSASGAFTRIGNLVHFHILVPSWTQATGSGGLQINGLPYSANDVAEYPCSVYNGGIPISAGNVIQAIVNQGANHVSINQYTPSTGSVSAIPLTASGGNFLGVNGSYRVKS